MMAPKAATTKETMLPASSQVRTVDSACAQPNQAEAKNPRNSAVSPASRRDPTVPTLRDPWTTTRALAGQDFEHAANLTGHTPCNPDSNPSQNEERRPQRGASRNLMAFRPAKDKLSASVEK
jgi:hypothetical protein